MCTLTASEVVLGFRERNRFLSHNVKARGFFFLITEGVKDGVLQYIAQ